MGKKTKFIGTIGRSVAETQFAFETKESPSKGETKCNLYRIG